jgi:hypothetical protein
MNNTKCYYLPQPPRAWSRVQNACFFNDFNDNNNNELQMTKLQMLEKGNILQYKCNSSNLTKKQRYSKIAKGEWVNRNTTWAVQSLNGYTNPNTTSLKRSGNVINIAIDPITGLIIGPTNEPPTCATQIIPINASLPENISGNSNEPIPPPINPSPKSMEFPEIIPSTIINPIVIQDGGVLICSIEENICTGKQKYSSSQKLFNPTSDSDVPGPIQELYWNDGMQTWYPRQRYVMTNSTNKWPVNYKLLVSAIKTTPNNL